MPQTLRLHRGCPGLLPPLLHLVQPGSPSCRHRIDDPRPGALRPGQRRPCRPSGRPGAGIPGQPGTLRAQSTHTAAYAHPDLDQPTPENRHQPSLNRDAGCLKAIDTFRSVLPRWLPPPVTIPADAAGPPRFRRDPFARDVASDPGGAMAPCDSGATHIAFGEHDGLGLPNVVISWLNPTPHAITVSASDPALPRRPQHSLPGGSLCLTRTGLAPVGSRQLRLAHRAATPGRCRVGPIGVRLVPAGAARSPG